MREAIRLYDQAISYDSLYFDSYIMKALCQEYLGELEPAEATLRTAMESATPETEIETRVQLHTNLGTVLFSLDRLEEAGTEYGKALELDPRAFPAWHNVGLVHENLGKKQRALQAFRQALQIQPDYVESRAAIARLGG